MKQSFLQHAQGFTKVKEKCSMEQDTWTTQT